MPTISDARCALASFVLIQDQLEAIVDTLDEGSELFETMFDALLEQDRLVAILASSIRNEELFPEEV